MRLLLGLIRTRDSHGMSPTDSPRPTMPLAELERIAEDIYGRDWQSPLSRDINVALRTVQRWAEGKNAPPDLRAEIADMCRAKAKKLVAIAERLERSR